MPTSHNPGDIESSAAVSPSKGEKHDNNRESKLLSVLNTVFPIAAVAALAFTVKSTVAEDYGLSVEYGGTNMGVVTDENVVNGAKIILSDRVKYYDTGDSFSTNASIKLQPLSGTTQVLDESELVLNMENLISENYGEATEEETSAEETEEGVEGKVKAYAVRVDGEFLGAVTDYEPIASSIESFKTAYNNNDYIKVDFEKKVVYDLEEYVDPEDVVSHADILKVILGRVGTTEYYEVKDGDWLMKIAEDLNMSLDELCKCYATYEGRQIQLGGDILKTGTLIKVSTTKPYLQLDCTKEETFRSPIAFTTVKIEDPTLAEGQCVVEKEGIEGERRSKVLVTYRNDIPVRKKTLETAVYSRPVPQVVRVGMAPSINHNVPQFKVGVGNGEYVWPVDGGYISAHVGDNRNHKGLDIAAPYGTPIYSAAAGTVIEASEGWSGGYGNNIKIQNDDGNICVYAHQSELNAEEGQHVEAGELIGFIGSTGDSTGNHLHFEVRQDGYFVDPEEYVSQ